MKNDNNDNNEDHSSHSVVKNFRKMFFSGDL